MGYMADWRRESNDTFGGSLGCQDGQPICAVG